MSVLEVVLASCVPLSPLPQQPARCRVEVRPSAHDTDDDDDLIAIEEACHEEWTRGFEVLEDDGQSTAASRAGAEGSHLRTPRLTKEMLMNDDLVWKKRIIPASRLPELLSRQQELRGNKKPTKGLGASNVQARERWSRAVASVSDSEGVDRTMSRVRNISKKVRSAMFYEDSGFSVLKMGNMLAQYHRAYEHKRYHRLNPFFDDVRGLSAPLDSMFESRAYEIVETMQLELSHSLQNELVRRAEPVELQRLDREADNILEQCQVSKKNMDAQLADLQAAVNKAASEAARFLDVARTELGALAADIADFTAKHNHLRKADIEYQADLFDQQRRNDALQDQLEKLTARRRLAETRLQADMESLRTENTVLKRSMGALSNLSKDNKKRLTEISNWMSVLCGRHLERNHDTMLMAYQKRVVRRQAFYERIAWVKLQHLRVVVEKLSKLLVERQEELKIARTRQEVRLYRRLTVEACCLLYEVRLRSGELQKDGRLTQNEAIEECLKKGKMKHRPIGLMMFFAKELGKPLKWMRKRHMEVSFSKDLVFSGSETVSTPLSLMEPGEFLMRQREIQLGVLREMRRASNPLETKVNDITNRFKQKMLEKRMTLKETGKVDGFDDVSSAEEEEEPDLDHSATMEPADPEAIKAILQSDYKGFFETVEAPAQMGVTEAAVADLPVASATAAVESVDASPPVDAEKALEDLFDLAKAQESLEQTCSSLLLQLSAVPGAQDAVAFFADLLEDLTTALRIGYIGASCLSDPANPRATPWKLRPHQLPWLPRHAALCAERCGVLRAVTAVLEGALPNLCPEPQVDEVGEASPTTSTKAISEAAAEAATSTLASVANFLVSLPPIATAEMTEVSEQCMTRVEKGLRRYYHLQNTACDACAQIQLSPGINLTSTEGKAEALPLGPSPHSFMTSSKGLQLLMDSKELASSEALTKLTEVEILDVLHTAARREYHLAMPECFRASVLALADLGGLFEEVSCLDTPMLPPEAVAGRSSPYQPGLWRFLAARRGPGVAGFLSPPDTSGELNATDLFHLDATMRNLSSRERAGTATDSSRPWTSTPRRPSTQDSTRLPSRQTGLGLTEPSDFESALMLLAGEKLHPSLDEDVAHEGEAEQTEEQRLEAERKAQEEEAANLENESEELAGRIQALRDRISRIAEQGGDASGDAWRMGDLMAEAAQAEELQAATRKTLQHRLHVAKLVKDQQARRKKQKDLMNEFKRLTQEASQQGSKAPSEADIGHLPSMGAALSEKEVGQTVSGGSTGRQKSKLSNIRTSSRQSSRQTSFSRQITPGSDRLEKDLAVRSRLAEIEEALAQLNLDIQLGETEEKNLEAEVETLEQERATRLEESDSAGPGRKGEQMPEEAMVAAYCSRVSQRSLWKVVLGKHKKARQVAKDYVAGLTAAKSQALEVPGEEVVATSSLRSLRSQKSLRAALSDASSRQSKGPSGRSSRRPPSKPRSATSAGGRSTSSRRANSKPASATSSPRMASPRRQAPKAAASPGAKAAATKGGAGIFVGAGEGPPAKHSARRTLTVNMGAPQRKASTSSLRRSSIESRRESEENADHLNDVMRVGGASPRPTGEVPVIAVQPPSSSGSSSGSWSTTSSEQDLDGKASPEPAPQPAPVVPQTRRANVMTGLLETKALRQEVQLSLGEQEIQKTNQWLDKWINGTTEEDEVGLPETSRSRRIGMVQDLSDWAKDISPLLVSSTLGIDLGNRGEAGELEVQKSASERSRSSERTPRSRSPKAEAQSLVGRNMRLMSSAGPDSSLMLFAKQGRGGPQRRLVSGAGGPQQRKKSPKKGKRGIKSRQGQMSSSDGTDTEQEAYRVKSGFLADPAVSKLRTQPYASAQPSKRREHSTSTALPSRGGEGLHNDSLLTLSSESVERHRFLSRNAISAAVAEHGEDQEKPRWKLPKGPLPKLVDVRKNGPGDVEAAKRAEKGHKASVSAAMVQAARMQPKRLRTPSKTAAEKPLSQAESRASLTEAKVVHFNQDPVEQSQDYEILSGERSSESPARSSRSGRSSRGGARSMSRPSSGWSLAESETGPVLSTFPKECKPPSLSARSKRVFSLHG